MILTADNRGRIDRAQAGAPCGDRATAMLLGRALLVNPDFVREHDGRLLVVHDGEAWRVNAGGRLFGEYATSHAAVLAAAGAAHILACGTRILMQDDDGAATPVWTEGELPFSPR